MPIIQSIGTAVPENRIDQKQIAAFMAQAHAFETDQKNKLLALYRASGISQRHSVIADYASLNPQSWSFYPASPDLKPFPSTQDRSKLYQKHALNLSVSAIKDCLQATTVDSKEITHLVTVSCTGMYAPGLDIDIVKKLGLSTSIQRTSINFMGCYAAITGMKAAHAICSAQKDAKVLVVATELCTIHFQNKTDDDNLLANAIFSDGSAAMLMSNDERESNSIRLKPQAFHCDLLPDGEKDMAWNIGDTGFEMKLSAYVPDLVQSGIKSLVNSLNEKFPAQSTRHYAIHPGGKKILKVIEEELQIEKASNAYAHEVLRNNGNMSSPTVLFVLKAVMEKLDKEKKGEQVLSLAFGPGLTLESVLFEII